MPGRKERGKVVLSIGRQGERGVRNTGPKDPALGCPLRGLQWSFPTGGSLLE